MTGSQRNSLEKMREKFQEAQIPEIKASSLKAWDNGIRIRKDADDRARGISAFKSPSKNIGASEIIQVTDKTGRSYRFELTATPKGWSFGGYTIDLYTNFFAKYGTREFFGSEVERALKENVKDLDFHRFLIKTHPIIGTAILLARNLIQDVAKEKGTGREKNADIDPTQWYERNMRLASSAYEGLINARTQLNERCSDQLALSFLNDMLKECELLIAEACNICFVIYDAQLRLLMQGKNPATKPYMTREAAFPISLQTYDQMERDILNLRLAYLEYFGDEKNVVPFPLPNRKVIAEKGMIELPIYATSDDVGSFLREFGNFWNAISDGLSKKGTLKFQNDYAHIANTLDMSIKSGSSQSQDRISFRAPAFNVRVDKDVRFKSLTFDIGSASLEHALACAYELIETPIKNQHVSIFKGTAESDSLKVLLENKMALLATLMMRLSQSVALRKQPTISHHSREFVAKDEYYLNFTHILGSIKEGLEKAPS